MILVTAYCVIQPDQRDRFVQACTTFSSSAREFQGVNRCLICELNGSQDGWLIFVEYAAAAAFSAYESSGELLQFMGEIGSLLADTPQIQAYEVSNIQNIM